FAESGGLAIVAEFIEVETGSGADALAQRPQLAAALAQTKKLKCPVIVAKLDRLSRDVAFIAAELGRRLRSIHAAYLCRAGGERAPHDLAAHQGRTSRRQSARRDLG